MNKLDAATRSQILHLLCEGQSIRAITRVVGASKNTVIKLLVDAGKACMAFLDANVQGVMAKRIQVDEIWSFTYAKQKNFEAAKAASDGVGDTWTWMAIDADSKLIVSYFVGGRDSDCAILFLDDLRSRLANRLQLTNDGHNAYLEAVHGAFGGYIDYAMLIKMYGPSIENAKGHFSPAECTGVKETRIGGSPDIVNVRTYFAECQKKTMWMHMRRFTCLTDNFSKKVENHAYAVALHMVYFNFVRLQTTLRTTPAMAAGIAARIWEIGDIVKLVEASEAKPAKRGP
jgi:hypothetical protein